jgi:NTP pyrophosphatase (non-canonical NTP hydrolase)
MEANEYQRWTRRFDNHRPEVMTGALVAGLCAEAGEVANEFERSCRNGKSLDVVKLMDELGDVQWNVARLAAEAGWTLSQLMEHNINKLVKRYEEAFEEKKP